jgi:hypothetical protein
MVEAGLPYDALKEFSNIVSYDLDMSPNCVWPHLGRSRCWGGENRYLRLRSDPRPVGIAPTDAAQG